MTNTNYIAQTDTEVIYIMSDGDFRVLVSTSENLEQGQVLLAVFGDKGSTGAIALSKPKEDGPRFKAGSTDEFKVKEEQAFLI